MSTMGGAAEYEEGNGGREAAMRVLQMMKLLPELGA